MSDLYVVIRDMSAGNAETGEAWQETKIFLGTATLDEVMLWANPEYDYKTKADAPPKYSHKRIILTKASVADELAAACDLSAKGGDDSPEVAG